MPPPLNLDSLNEMACLQRPTMLLGVGTSSKKDLQDPRGEGREYGRQYSELGFGSHNAKYFSIAGPGTSIPHTRWSSLAARMEQSQKWHLPRKRPKPQSLLLPKSTQLCHSYRPSAYSPVVNKLGTRSIRNTRPLSGGDYQVVQPHCQDVLYFSGSHLVKQSSLLISREGFPLLKVAFA